MNVNFIHTVVFSLTGNNLEQTKCQLLSDLTILILLASDL
jgi:hypothetical protein